MTNEELLKFMLDGLNGAGSYMQELLYSAAQRRVGVPGEIIEIFLDNYNKNITSNDDIAANERGLITLIGRVDLTHEYLNKIFDFSGAGDLVWSTLFAKQSVTIDMIKHYLQRFTAFTQDMDTAVSILASNLPVMSNEVFDLLTKNSTKLKPLGERRDLTAKQVQVLVERGVWEVASRYVLSEAQLLALVSRAELGINLNSALVNQKDFTEKVALTAMETLYASEALSNYKYMGDRVLILVEVLKRGGAELNARMLEWLDKADDINLVSWLVPKWMLAQRNKLTTVEVVRVAELLEKYGEKNWLVYNWWVGILACESCPSSLLLKWRGEVAGGEWNSQVVEVMSSNNFRLFCELGGLERTSNTKIIKLLTKRDDVDEKVLLKLIDREWGTDRKTAHLLIAGLAKNSMEVASKLYVTTRSPHVRDQLYPILVAKEPSLQFMRLQGNAVRKHQLALAVAKRTLKVMERQGMGSGGAEIA